MHVKGRLRLTLAMASIVGLVASSGALAADKLALEMTYLKKEIERLAPLSLLDPIEIPDEGFAGAALGQNDNQTTGGFLGHDYALAEVRVAIGGDLIAAAKETLAAGARLLVIDAPAEELLEIADLPEAEDALFFNVSAEADRLRTEDCRANIFHIIPSRAMKADALAQYLAWKQWRQWFLIHGTAEPDLLMKAAIERAAVKFGAKVVETRAYEYEATARRTDSGHVQVQTQLPVFTQNAAEHDVVIAADESDIFGEYLDYRTWVPRPVAGTHGLRPTAWHRSHEAWGGTQMQGRFEDGAGRWMTEKDYAAWLAVRTIGEAVTRTDSSDPAVLRDYLRSDQFEIAAFKGEGLTFRPWNQQMRQPVILVGPRMLVSVSPQDQFLHQRTPLDTLGFDQPESSCSLG
ncbi:MAG: ABC transporter substrate-binding protein [Alphaproteobacteria bacterium]|nr:ABC transporter substrate-binding protein [Alphaproteobacteria bacterium]